MAQVDRTAGELIARAIAARASRGAFGVLVRDMPHYDAAELLGGLGHARAAGAALRVAMPNLAGSLASNLRGVAHDAGFDDSSFVTTIEGAERWRNDASISDTIVVVIEGEIPKLNSLNRFETLSGMELYKQVCSEADSSIGANEAQRQLWRALQHKPVMRITPLEGLLAYYAELRSLKASEIPTRSRELLYLLGLLPDPDLFSQPTAAKIAHRLIENQRVVDQIEVLTRTDRQRISRALAARAGAQTNEALQVTYQKVMTFYREQDPQRLSELTLRDVQKLLRTKDQPGNGNGADDGDGNDEGRPKAEARPTMRALDMLISEDDDALLQLAEVVQRVLESEDGDEDDIDARDPQTGATLDIRAAHPFQRIVERYVTPSLWGGVIDSPADSLDEALMLIDKAEFLPFDPDSKDWALRATLAEIAKDRELGVDLVQAFDSMVACRRELAKHVRELLLYPLVQINSTREYASTGEEYLSAYKRLIEGLKRSYESIAEIAPEGIEVLCSQLLALDTILFKTNSGLKAILSPLHPLHLWKHIELSRQLRLQAGGLSEREKGLLRSRVEDLPNFVTTLYVSNYISGSGAKVLPEAGARRGLPFYEEFASQFAGRDGIKELSRLFEKFCLLYPHARLGLRIAFVDPPDVEFLLRELVRVTERAAGDLDGVHVRIFFTRRPDATVGALGGGAEDEAGAERFRGVGTLGQFTMEVHEGAIALSELITKLDQHPAHLVVLFDPSTVRTQRFARAPSLGVQPLCLPMQFSYDRITKSVRVVPAADGGIFSDHNDLRNRLSHHLTGAFFGVTAELQAQQRELARLATGGTWLVVADRAQEGALSFGVPRVSLQRCGKRDLAVYATGLDKFVAEFDAQLRRCNYTPSPIAVARLIDDLGALLSDGLLALIGSSPAGMALDQRRTQGLLGTLVTSAWFRRRHKRCLVVSIDSQDARRWLELAEDASRADLFGVVDEPDGGVTIDLIEVKTYQHPEQAFRIAGEEISGDAINQILNTARIVDEIFAVGDGQQRLVAPQRREILRQQLFRECFFEGRTDDEKQFWSGRLNEVFALDVPVRIRLSLVVVGLTQARPPAERMFRAQGREIRLIELTEEEVRRHVSEVMPSGQGQVEPGVDTHRRTAPGEPARIAGGSLSVSAGGSEDEDDDSANREEGASEPGVAAQHGADEGSAIAGDERSLIEKQAADLKRILRDHSIGVQELDPDKAQIGPSVIRFRVRLKPGAKVASLRTRAEDIGRELACRATPFIDNIAGERYVGIDLERPRRQTIALWPAIQDLPVPVGLQLPVATGVTPDGSHVQLDLVQLPHLLVAGSTMSGKTVFLHAVALSLIGRLRPDQVELLIVDPKATDFVHYNGLQYLRGGRVITESEEAIEQLRLLTGDELRTRTGMLQDARCPNLSVFNAENPNAAIKPIVVLIDEYADLIAVLSKKDRVEFEREVNRLAQRARSIGIHLVLATQRPTADIVTGLLKANMPCRISFRLPQRVDSQTILDQSGAENLFGRGDMLLLQNDRLTRLQGYFMPVGEIADLLAGVARAGGAARGAPGRSGRGRGRSRGPASG